MISGDDGIARRYRAKKHFSIPPLTICKLKQKERKKQIFPILFSTISTIKLEKQTKSKKYNTAQK